MNEKCEIELPNGTRFKVGNVCLEVTEAYQQTCIGCYLFGKRKHCANYNLNCLAKTRTDRKSVVFREVINENEIPRS